MHILRVCYIVMKIYSPSIFVLFHMIMGLDMYGIYVLLTYIWVHGD